ncbi:MAG: glycosyltransferase [Sedimenticola sp.]|nr:glycosyltransferase [Sedimenticola sp.]
MSSVDSYRVYSAGISLDEGAAKSEHDYPFQVITFDLWSGRLDLLPRPLKYALIMLELTFRLVKSGRAIKPKVVHCHDTLVLAAGVIIKLITGAKLVYDAHELESKKNAQSPILSRSTLFLEKVCWRYVDLLITVSPSIIDWYISNLGEKSSALILNSPMVESIEKGGKNALDPYKDGYFHQRYDIPRDRIIYIYVGLLVQGRGIESIISIFSQRDIKSHVVFVGYGSMKDEIGRISCECENVHLHEPVPHEDVVSLVKNADIGLCLIENVSLSDFYCLPNKLFEYGFAGVPILASKFPDIEKVVSDHKLGYCCDNDAQSIAKAIKKIEREGRSENGNSDLSKLSWEAQAERLIEKYSELLKSS